MSDLQRGVYTYSESVRQQLVSRVKQAVRWPQSVGAAAAEPVDDAAVRAGREGAGRAQR